MIDGWFWEGNWGGFDYWGCWVKGGWRVMMRIVMWSVGGWAWLVVRVGERTGGLGCCS